MINEVEIEVEIAVPLLEITLEARVVVFGIAPLLLGVTLGTQFGRTKESEFPDDP